MEPSLAGISAFLMIAVWLRLTQRPIVVGLLASLAFGATTLVTLDAMGGSSPLLYAFFLLFFLASITLRRQFSSDLATVFARQPASWIVVLLMAYVIIGAIFMPRLFAGQTGAFVPLRDEGRIAEVPLAPVTGNITQCLYFVLSALSFLAFSVFLLDQRKLSAIHQGFLAWSVLHVGMGYIDLFGKISGYPDILSPIRSASYSMLTSVSEGSFWRIAGGYAEASSFGGITLSLLVYWFAHWRKTNEQKSLVLSLFLFLLLLLSTSSTAYVGAMIACVPLAYSILSSALRGRMSPADLTLLLTGILVITALIAINLYDERVFDPVWDLVDSMILNKATSASAQERSYWNIQSLKSFYDTSGLGIGIGSSRASSWIIAVISQLGLIGVILLGTLLVELFRGPAEPPRTASGFIHFPVVYSVRAASLAGLVTASISGGDADPGLRFFLAIACLDSWRNHCRYGAAPAAPVSRIAYPARTQSR